MRAISGLIGFVSAVLGILSFVAPPALIDFFRTFSKTISEHIVLFGLFVAVVSCVITLVILRYIPIKLKEFVVGMPTGGVVLFNNRDDDNYNKLFKKLLSTAKSVDIAGIANSQFTEREWPLEFKESITKNHTIVRFLFLNPNGSKIQLREVEEGLSPGILTAQVKTHIGHLEKKISALSKELPKIYQLVNYKFYDRYPSHNIVIIDEKHVFFQPYFFSTIGRENSIYYIGKSNVNEAKKIAAEFNRIWNEADSTPNSEK